MFFQSIYQMITAGTDLNINIRKVDNSLSVAVMPRRNSLKEDTRQNMVPLVGNGTGQIIQGSNSTGRIKGSQGKTGKDGKAPQKG